MFYNVIDTELISEKSKLSCEDELEGQFKILTVGRLHNQKGYDIAIQSAKILKERGIKFNGTLLAMERKKKI